MKKILFTIVLLAAFVISNAQYATPGTGVNWTLDDLVSNSGGVVSLEVSGQYSINNDLTISTSDSLSILTAQEINVMEGVLITVAGTLISQPESGIVFFKAFTNYYLGFRFDDGGNSLLTNTYFKKAGGIRLINTYVEFEACDFTEFNQEYSTGTINLSSSSPLISNCSFTYNDGPAVMSGANSTSSPQVIGCEIKFNVVSNSNTPQINLGTSGADSIRIIGNQIIGNPENIMAGGIAITTLAGGSLLARIEGNLIRDNRYGITVYGYNIGSVICDNEVLDNNIQNLPLSGGSGFNFFGDETNQSMVYGNIVSGNLWGVTIQGTAQPNFGQLEGDDYNPGTNHFYDNSNDGVIYDFYNNTPNPIMAQNNYWGTMDQDSVEMHIYHQPDDPSLGLVEYLPLYDPFVGVNELFIHSNQNGVSTIFPNPASNYFYVEVNPELNYREISVYDATGKKLSDVNISFQENLIRVSLPANYSGFVFVCIDAGGQKQTGKVLVQ